MNIFLLIGVCSFMLFSLKNNYTFSVIRAKGIVIVDEKGKDRILIRAPIPYSKDRVRTNMDKV